MANYVPEEIIDRIRDSADIVSVIEEYLPLKKAGSIFRGLCPFHKEQNPSFTVYPSKQIFRCYGCGKGGNVFTFLMLKENLTFPEVIELLSRKLNIPLPEKKISPEMRKKAKRRETMLELNMTICNLYHKNLFSAEGKRALEYLKDRGLTTRVLKDFKLGYAPDDWHFITSRYRGDITALQMLEEMGLVGLTKDGTEYYDIFRDKIIFPILGMKGEVVGFGSRVLDNSEPKYINSKESEIYKKGATLYGLNLAKNYILKENEAIIVEGYIDLITCYNYEVRNVVATLGTALTPEHSRMIRRLTDRIVFLYDADEAGINATMRAIKQVLPMDFDIKVCLLPSGEDPDSFLRKNNKEALLDLMAIGKSGIDFLLSRYCDTFDVNSIKGKQMVINEMLPILQEIESDLARTELCRVISEKINIEDEILISEWKKSVKVRKDKITFPSGDLSAIYRTEAKLIILMAYFDEAAKIAYQKLNLDYISNETFRKMAEIILREVQKGHEIKPSKIFDLFQEQNLLYTFNEISSDIFSGIDVENEDILKTTLGCIQSLERTMLKKESKKIDEELKKARETRDNELILSLLKKKDMLCRIIGEKYCGELELD